jgi:thiol-disulfide isomerase/thioredoxin
MDMLANDPDRRTFLRATAVALAGGSFGLLRHWQAAVDRTNAFALADELSALGSATAWINSPPLSAAGLKGKVVLVQFWTFTCINWLRTLPYTRTWAKSYGNAGLVVIGVHTPEFAFEHDLTNVRRAAADLKVEYPIAVDNDYAIWRGFSNQYWPAIYLLDATGRVRYHQFGEGGYAESEGMIRQLLDEAGAQDAAHKTVVVGRGIEAAADWDDLRSVENYVGYARTEGFSSPGGAGRRRTYTATRELRLNQWALEGDWTIERDAIVLNRPNGKIAYCFHGRDLHLVMGPPAGARAVRFRVTLDGQPPGATHGVDVDAQGNGVATVQRLHQLIRQSKPIVDRVFRIEYLDPGVEAYSFTFG